MSKRKRESKEDKGKKKHDDIDDLDEAIEEKVSLSEGEGDESSEPEGEDLAETMGKDYKPIKALDEYENVDIDDEEYEKLSPEERRKVDQALNQRDQQRRVGSRVPAAVFAELEGTEDEDLERQRRKKQITFAKELGENEEYKENDIVDATKDKGKIAEWLQEIHAIRYIRQQFEKFIKQYKEEDKFVYETKIIDMSSMNGQSLEVSYAHLQKTNPYLAQWVVAYPDIVLPYLNDMLFELTNEIFPHYSEIVSEIFVRIRDIPFLISLRNLRSENIGHLIKIKGVITKRTTVYPKMKVAYFTCTKCGERNGPFTYSGIDDEINIGTCPVCQSNGPYRLESDQCVYRNYQRITIQESPGTVPPGRVPRQKEVILTNDLVDIARPGDEVEITGIYKSKNDYSANLKNSFPVFTTFIEANCIKRLNDIEVSELTEEDKIELRRLAKKQNIRELIFNSIAPSIYGNDFIKKALAIAMFGGVAKDPQGKHKIRGDINVLLLGDPGTAKSQFLKYIQKVFSRSVYTTGKGASAVGLTAGVHKDPVTKEWTLEGGALVLADKGLCLIDEFDKMNDQDRTSIHEAMEQQSISISKAGIVTSLQARCSVIAAANPIKGRYDNLLSFGDNVELTDPILSRFDILCVVKDQVDPVIDNQLATFVINSHIMSHPGSKGKKDEALLEDTYREAKETLAQEMLKKYILYARKYVQPKLTELNKNKVAQFYAELRKESEKVGGISIAVRHLESLLRIAEASAKMQLREIVRSDDIDFAIQIMLESFLQSQKFSIAKNLRKKFAHYLVAKEDHVQLLLNLLSKLAKDNYQYMKYFNTTMADVPTEIKVGKDAFEKEASDLGIHNVEEFYKTEQFKAKHTIEGKDIICKF